MIKTKRRLVTLKLSIQGDTLKRLACLKECQMMTHEQVQTKQQGLLEGMLLHAYNRVPYYKKLFNEHGFLKKDGVVDLTLFSKIPLLTKKELKENFNELKSDDLSGRKWNYNKSGGSTGEPVLLIQDKEYSDWRSAVKIIFDLWSHYSMADGQIMLWGSESDLFIGRETNRVRLGRWLRNEIWLNAFRMTTERTREYIKLINQAKPARILAYASAIYELSCLAEREGLDLYSPRSIMATGSTLHQNMRETVEKKFKTRVFNRYGSREVGDIACECDHHKGLHVSALTHFVEILRPDGTPTEPGETGEIVVTLLTNFAMPLIRYRIGDMGAWARESCTCGRGLPFIKEITGRVTDVFTKRDGGVVVPEYLIHLIGVVLNKGWILKYQAVQEDYDFVRILLVPQSSLAGAYTREIEEIKDKICLVMGQDCRVEFNFVKDIPPTASGKHQYTISKVKR